MNAILVGLKNEIRLITEELKVVYQRETKYKKLKQSQCGRLFGYISPAAVMVCSTKDGSTIFECRSSASDYFFSPKGKQLCTIEESRTATLWDIETGAQKTKKMWAHTRQPFMWLLDDSAVVEADEAAIRVQQAEGQLQEICEEGLCDLSTSPKDDFFCLLSKTKAGLYVLRLKKPGLEKAVSQLSVARADGGKFFWAADGRAVLFLAQNEHTKTNYYSDDSLFLLSEQKGSLRILSGATGSIHSVAWLPSSFIVVYGSMPAKIEEFDLSGKVIRDWSGLGSKNHARINKAGNMLCLGGFGNLQGRVDVLLHPSKRRIGEFSDRCACLCEWAADGSHIMTATTTPGMRVDNGIKLWTPAGELAAQIRFDILYLAEWRRDHGAGQRGDPAAFKELPVTEKKAIYRPPGKRK